MFKPWSAIGAVLLAFSLVIPACAYDVPLTESSIRDAYFLGTRTGGLNADYFARYAHWIPELKQWTCTSQMRFETPFLQVAEYASTAPNYTAQDAVKAFSDKPMLFKMYLDICYQEKAPANALKIKIIQNKKEIAPLCRRKLAFLPRRQRNGHPSCQWRTDLPRIQAGASRFFDPHSLDRHSQRPARLRRFRLAGYPLRLFGPSVV